LLFRMTSCLMFSFSSLAPVDKSLLWETSR
jgi:hypothetical protein